MGSEEQEVSVCVAVKIRPLLGFEIEQNSTECVFVPPGSTQVSTKDGSHTFNYDQVYGGDGGPDEMLYPQCVEPLLDGLFKGYNATVFAYGQTGSGKTHTMGSAYTPGGPTLGVIPEVMEDIFKRIQSAEGVEYTVRVSFVEIHQEEIRDLLAFGKPGPRAAVSLRQVAGSICLHGAEEKEVRSKAEMVSALEQGTLCRVTASTAMNQRSSRSHAIFTITLEQRRLVDSELAEVPSAGGSSQPPAPAEEFIYAKMHLVDLAGSERAKKTGAVGQRFREGVSINKSLLALGNVIVALVDGKKHIPYRESKLTRLLQDSLGGNSRTVMIACVSPASSNYEETVNSLRYADRARHIRNRPTVNRDPSAAELASLRAQVGKLRAENEALRRQMRKTQHKHEGGEGGAAAGGEETTSLVQLQLQKQLEAAQAEVANLRSKLLMAQTQCSKYKSMLDAHASSNPSSHDAAADNSNQKYLEHIRALEEQLMHFGCAPLSPGSIQPNASKSAANGVAKKPPANRPSSAVPGKGATDPSPPKVTAGEGAGATPDTATEDEEVGIRDLPGTSDDEQEEGDRHEQAVSALEAAEWASKCHAEMDKLQRQIEVKDAKMRTLQQASMAPELKAQYEHLLSDLQKEVDKLARDRAELQKKLSTMVASSEEERKRLEAQYKEKLRAMDEKLRDLQEREKKYRQLQQLKQRTEDACSRLQGDIQKLKEQKVRVQKQAEEAQKRFHVWKQEYERELLQLRKKNRRDALKLQQYETMAAKQQAVAKRKTEEAEVARKRLKDMMEVGAGRSSRDRTPDREDTSPEVQPNVNAPLLRTEKGRKDWLDTELDACSQSLEFQRLLSNEMAERTAANRQLKEVEKKLMLLDNLQPTSPLVTSGTALSSGGYPGAAMYPNTPSSRYPLTPGGIGRHYVKESRESLLQRKDQLERQVEVRSRRCSQLRQEWQKAKLMEETRGAGASDIKRWQNIRNGVEARDLLRTLFRAAYDHKVASAEAQMECTRLQEALDVSRTQLDAARQQAAAARARAAAAEANLELARSAAVAASSVDMSESEPDGARADESDELDSLLEELRQAATRPKLEQMVPGVPARADGVSMAPPSLTFGAATSSEPHNTVVKSLDFAQRGPDDQAASAVGRATSPTASALQTSSHPVNSDLDTGASFDVPSRSTSNTFEIPAEVDTRTMYHTNEQRPPQLGLLPSDSEGEAGSGDDPNDTTWNPAHPTPAGRRRRSNSRQSVGSSGGRTRSQPLPSSLTSRESYGGHGSSRQEWEAPALEAINKRLQERRKTQAKKLTIALLKDFLDGSFVDGRPWKAGKKTKDDMIMDLRKWLGHAEAAPPPTQVQTFLGSAARVINHITTRGLGGGAARLPANGVATSNRAPIPPNSTMYMDLTSPSPAHPEKRGSEGDALTPHAMPYERSRQLLSAPARTPPAYSIPAPSAADSPGTVAKSSRSPGGMLQRFFTSSSVSPRQQPWLPVGSSSAAKSGALPSPPSGFKVQTPSRPLETSIYRAMALESAERRVQNAQLQEKLQREKESFSSIRKTYSNHA